MPTLAFALAFALVAPAAAEEPLLLPATITLPRVPDALTPTSPSEYFMSFTRPSSRVVLIGAERPPDRLPDAGTPCPCDHVTLRCAITSSGARLGWSGTPAQWPLLEAPLGTCSAGDVLFPVSIALSGTASSAWWRGPRELVVSVPAVRTRPVEVAARTWSGMPEGLTPEEGVGGVVCAIDATTKAITVKVAPEATTGTSPCLLGPTTQIAVRLTHP